MPQTDETPTSTRAALLLERRPRRARRQPDRWSRWADDAEQAESRVA